MINGTGAKRAIIPIFVPHLGCPHDCVFCNQRRISGQTEPATAEGVHRIIKDALLKLPSGTKPEAAFYGGSFTTIPRGQMLALLSAAHEYLDKGAISSIRVSTRPDAISQEILDDLSAYGVKTVELGLQSMDDRVLEKSCRGHSSEDSRRAVKMIKERRLSVIAQMMCYLPGDEDGERSVFTAEEIIKLKPEGVRIYPVVVIKDTALYDMWRRGEYKAPDVSEAAALCGRLIGMFRQAGVTVIRAGLNPSEELSSGVAAAGAYHPAFGELALGEYCYNLIERAIEGSVVGKTLRLGVAKNRVSCFAGHKGINKKRLADKYGLKRISIVPMDMPEDRVIIID